MLIPFLILVFHFVGDFLCQSDKMAMNKSTSNSYLTLHVLIYTAVIGVLPFAVYAVSDIMIYWYWVAINGVLHWITDYFTSRLTSYLYKKEMRHWFFVAIGFDQLIHYACLLFSYQLITQ